jgi:hypothetical protein
MYQVAKDFAGPIATIMAAFAAVSVTAFFAWQQKKISGEQARVAKEKLRYDLFERRMAIFSSLFPFYDAMLSWQGTPEQVAARNRFFRAYQESGFLFGKESGIEDLLKNLNDSGMKVIGFKENKEHLKEDKELMLRLFNEAQDIQVRLFPNALTQLKNAMSGYMNFHNL